jgi:hypothetical protein
VGKKKSVLKTNSHVLQLETGIPRRGYGQVAVGGLNTGGFAGIGATGKNVYL